MFIVQAIRKATNEYVVYFMLAAWLEALEHDGNAETVPEVAKRLPVRSPADVRRRLAAVREKVDCNTKRSSDMRVLRDAAAAFHVACRKLRALQVA